MEARFLDGPWRTVRTILISRHQRHFDLLIGSTRRIMGEMQGLGVDRERLRSRGDSNGEWEIFLSSFSLLLCRSSKERERGGQ